jgi:hypothetical protein
MQKLFFVASGTQKQPIATLELSSGFLIGHVVANAVIESIRSSRDFAIRALLVD